MKPKNPPSFAVEGLPEPSLPNFLSEAPMIIMHPEDYEELIKYLKEAIFEGPSAPGGKIDIKTNPCVKRGTIVKLNIPSDEEYAKILKQIELTTTLLTNPF